MRSTWKLPQFYPWSGLCPVRQKACLADLDKVRQKELVNGLGGVGHENTASEGGFLEKIGQGSSMIQVKVSDEKNIDCGRVNLVEIGQSSHARVSWVYSTIEQDRLAFVGHVDAWTTHFISSAQWSHYQLIFLSAAPRILTSLRRTIYSSSTKSSTGSSVGSLFSFILLCLIICNHLGVLSLKDVSVYHAR